MVGIGKTWRFTVRNSLAVDVAAAGVVLAGRLVRFDSTGKQEFGTDASYFSNGATVTNGAYASGAEQDNSTERWLGGDFVATVIAPAGSNGRVDIYYERKVSGQWPGSGLGRLIASVDIAASGTVYKDFSI